jgi:hypothetical protein
MQTETRDFPRNRVSKRKRDFAMDPVDYDYVRILVPILQLLHAANKRIFQRSGQYAQSITNYINEFTRSLQILTEYYPNLIRRKLTPMMTSLIAASNALPEHEFKTHFVFSLSECEVLIPLLLPNPIYVRKKGKITNEEAFLLLTSRLHGHKRTLECLEDEWGRDSSTLSAFVRETIRQILLLHGFRLDIEKMYRYTSLCTSDRLSFLNKFRDATNNNGIASLPDYFADCGWTLDGKPLDLIDILLT